MERLYDELAPWWHLVSDPADYAHEAVVYGDLLASPGAVREVLELGSGGGHTAGHLKRRFVMTLSDRSPAMLEVSRRRHPECDHILGDMRELRLGARFDAVFIHDALAYLQGEADLRAALATAAIHCRPGGAVLLVPDFVAETHAPSSSAGGGDDGERSLRFLEWIGPLEEGGPGYPVDYAFLLREGRGEVRVVADHHRCAAHPRALWEDGCRGVGLEPEWHQVTLDGRGQARHLVCLCRAT